MEQGKEYLINNSTIKIIFGSILDSHAEVIVSSDDSNITMGGGVSYAINMKEGTNAIFVDAKKNVPAEIGDVIVSTAGSLPQKNIFHVITLDFNSLNPLNTKGPVSIEEIHQYIIGHSIDKCFMLLHAMDLTSIAFPCIGAGVAGIPYNRVASAMSEAIARNLRKTNKSFNIELYLFDRFNRMGRWDFLPVFEQFSAQEAISKIINEQINDNLITEDIKELIATDTIPDINNDVFISYSRKDSDIVMQIYNCLKKTEYNCWLDVDGMFSGVSYKKVIVDAIKSTKVMLFMSSENSNLSRNVVNEVSIAMKYGKKIIPIRLDMSPYSASIEYDIINHDYVVYDNTRKEDSNKEILRKLVSTLRMI